MPASSPPAEAGGEKAGGEAAKAVKPAVSWASLFCGCFDAGKQFELPGFRFLRLLGHGHEGEVWLVRNEAGVVSVSLPPRVSSRFRE